MYVSVFDGEVLHARWLRRRLGESKKDDVRDGGGDGKEVGELAGRGFSS